MLARAKALQLLDVSFTGISWANVEDLQSFFPNVNIKRSFS
jgi:transcriptional regulator GlxA family with amidase domain